MSTPAERSLTEFLTHVSENISPLDFVLIADHLDKFFYGALLTLQVAAIALALGGILSVPLAVARAYEHRWLNRPIWFYCYFFRGTPLLVQTYLIYYGLAQFDAVHGARVSCGARSCRMRGGAH